MRKFAVPAASSWNRESRFTINQDLTDTWLSAQSRSTANTSDTQWRRMSISSESGIREVCVKTIWSEIMRAIIEIFSLSAAGGKRATDLGIKTFFSALVSSKSSGTASISWSCTVSTL